jgi:hypothetical protein
MKTKALAVSIPTSMNVRGGRGGLATGQQIRVLFKMDYQKTVAAPRSNRTF